jgi:two-component system, cell cycle response regulator
VVSGDGRPVETAPGRGRPEHPSPRVIDLAEGADRGAARPEKVRVLLVEDDPLFANLVVSILHETAEFEVEYVPRLSTALARLVRDRISLILADLNLPDSSGPVTVGFLRRAAPDIPVIVLSGVDDVQVALEAVREGADEYVVKGRFSVDSLVWLVRLVLERHRRVASAPAGGDVDPLSGFANLSALQVVGRHLLRISDRTGLHLGVVFLGVEAAPRGPWADWERLVVWMCDLLRHTLRRCDLLSRIGQRELAVLLVSEGPLGGAIDRLKEAITDGGAGALVRVGFAAYEPEDRTTLDRLLEDARRSAHAVLT